MGSSWLGFAAESWTKKRRGIRPCLYTYIQLVVYVIPRVASGGMERRTIPVPAMLDVLGGWG